MTDEDYMRAAVALAAGQVGRTGANPSVGCVIVRDGQIVGEGVTGPGGTPHGEDVALAAAGDRARGAIVYVTLEPCAQRSAGGTSCTDLLIAAGVSRVVTASSDPSVFAAGIGAQRLRDAGIATHQGLIREESDLLYVAYVPAKAIESRR